MRAQVWARAARYPLTVCPECRRDVRATPNSERVYPHRDPDTGDRCAGSGQHIDLYGTNPTPNGTATP